MTPGGVLMTTLPVPVHALSSSAATDDMTRVTLRGRKLTSVLVGEGKAMYQPSLKN
jgi:hypothetical protein